MRLRTIAKILLTSSVIILCAGFVLYFFFRLSAVDKRKNFNLYALVPPTATAVLATDNASDLVAGIEYLVCSEAQKYPHISKVISSVLKEYVRILCDKASDRRQMNRLLISFHEPGDEYSQVLYFHLNADDRQLFELFIRKNLSSSYSSKVFTYKGENIYIYPMPDGDFLSYYPTKDCLVLSYQKNLVEEVIDAQKTKLSLAHDSIFEKVGESHQNASVATLYARMRNAGGWMEFDMQWKEGFVSLSGTVYESDSCAFISTCRRQLPFSASEQVSLPIATFYFSRQRVSDWGLLSAYDESVECRRDTGQADATLDKSEEFIRYLKENGGQDFFVCLFQRENSAANTGMVAQLQVADREEAERMLYSFVGAASAERGKRKDISWLYTVDKAYPIYRLPSVSSFVRFAGFPDSSLPIYVTFYKTYLLAAADKESLSYYIHCLDKGKGWKGSCICDAGIADLPDSCHFMLKADLGKVLILPDIRSRFIPEFFFLHSDFFCRFVVFVRFGLEEGTVHSNVVLQCRSGNPD